VLLFLAAMFLFWLLARALSASGLILLGCAPVATVLCWAIWLQAQGWPGTTDEDLGLLLVVGLAVGLGMTAGHLLRLLVLFVGGSRSVGDRSKATPSKRFLGALTPA